jgi:crotonobetainyl-CoA:carnitine CoA-transferase CaiB-like acyl-CoA transferase
MLLAPYRVLDLAGPLGALAGRILADLGADVVKIEPPGGDPARQSPPFISGSDRESSSLSWLALNANKRGVSLDLASAGGRVPFETLVREADFLIETFEPGYLAGLGLGWDGLQQINPRVILVSITPFGQHGPYRSHLASDLEIMAASGAMSLAGGADEEPMRVTAPQAAMWVGAEAAMGALTALVARSGSGRGQHVDVSAQAAVLAALAHAPVFWDLNGVNPERAGIFITGRSITGAKMRAFWPCRDGWINFIIYGGAAGRHTNEQLVAWMAERGMAPAWLMELNWKDFNVTSLEQAEVDRLEAPIGDFFATVTKEEFLEEAVGREMLGYPVASVADIAASRQLQARGFWQDLVEPESGVPVRFPGSFAIVDGVRLAIRRSAPRLGEHNREILDREIRTTIAPL